MKEQSFGVIPLRRGDGEWEILLVLHGKGHWAFPKGHPEEGETPQETATRELFEETALTVKRQLFSQPLKEHYFFKREGGVVEKNVTYLLAEVEGEVEIQVEEISDFRWIPLIQAERLATFPETKRLIQQLQEIGLS
ncbi:MAG: Diadenosine hexaphosphate hydrolase [Chlamydiae bacterium]|nr:Diadenosine hexaphosphate hydrolase [Chlamydiota bacterium]